MDKELDSFRTRDGKQESVLGAGDLELEGKELVSVWQFTDVVRSRPYPLQRFPVGARSAVFNASRSHANPPHNLRLP